MCLQYVTGGEQTQSAGAENSIGPIWNVRRRCVFQTGTGVFKLERELLVPCVVKPGLERKKGQAEENDDASLSVEGNSG